ncbi:hypothetical protein CVT26_002079 [Gymnopilus dilepis]|uniref:FMR1-interacting protein 1 conserved domain-containing protein n=1 Tax=Gymnopilus dilepis TaxID=231916 RepID=A0A409VBL1_9AGAR|nr:hypothetical protein CVT26_002079 [Gymnopilus dilepis]
MYPPPHPAQSTNNAYQSASYNAFYPAYYNSHYMQAYSQQRVVNQNAGVGVSSSRVQGNDSGRDARSNSMPFGYQPGNSRCSHPGCTFTGSAKTVEIHMMDRHLIYPPGWDKRKKKPEWDADPSLKGKPIPIQGTNIILDTPEILEAWINERKSRFPTAARVEEKKRKFEEAVSRGQLDLSESRWPNKRRNMGTSAPSGPEQRQRSRQANSRGRFQDRVHRGTRGVSHPVVAHRIDEKRPSETTRQKSPSILSDSQSESDDDSGSNGQPEALSSKLVPVEGISVTEDDSHAFRATSTARPAAKKPPSQPKLPPKNPFASRPTLLRNLLLPEIRVTVSNLSQAIRFLVDNDFLRDVELKPGQAAESHKIEVLKPGQSKENENVT